MTIKRNLMLVGFFGFVCLAAGSEVGCNAHQQDPATMTKKQVEVLIRKELPSGSSEQSVLRFLTSRNIEHSADDSQSQKRILAIIRTAPRNGLVTKSIQIIFNLTRNGVLENYTVAEIFTGP